MTTAPTTSSAPAITVSATAQEVDAGGSANVLFNREAYQACLKVAEDLVKRHMAQYDPSHDWAHVERVRNTAVRIAAGLPGVDMKVVELAALFHDVAAKYTSSSTLRDTLAPFLNHPLTAASLTHAQVFNILDIVPCVSWTAEKTLRAKNEWTERHGAWLELHAVQDADRLDAIGAIGIMRCSAFGAVKGRLLVDDGEGEGSSEAHFEEKLFLIKDRMKTDFGKAEAERRHSTMKAWMEALQAEKQVCTTME
ncbi:uncharacterized protein MKK02DRAFT_38018 [Dioszegia hungarica]|uniref:HD/PDEase domain-containing protein n=1 Tax=Dioszegia hungarica TaxID=4972 RepID=A0AA38H5Q1_9TREE|nr:uncharacterized protein MKK02DRAFT_38018 [Dioszegia hungarica]KAI9634488.1 hypothetical protein MKK02DRAFT_38018 [Dioszegia hungarica]